MAYAGRSGERRPAVAARRIGQQPAGAVAVGMAVGLLVGAGVALLVTAETGPQVRRMLRRRARRAGLRGRDAWDDLRIELARSARHLRRGRRRRMLAAGDLVVG